MHNLKDSKNLISLDDTLFIKGIAICLMLWHHLFCDYNNYGWFVHQSSLVGRTCVAIFLFLSAYGLTTQFQKITILSRKNISYFITNRCLKFYLNYWYIFIIMIPVGSILGKTIDNSYPDNQTLTYLITDLFALNYTSSYNITWWFNSLIIWCYIIFPLLYFFAKKSPFIFLISILVLHIVPLHINIVLYKITKTYLLSFALGIIVATHKNIIIKSIQSAGIRKTLVITLIALVFFIIIRQNRIIPGFFELKVDPFLAISISLLSIISLRKYKILNTVFINLGKHSMNIYMLHTFIYLYFFEEFVYSFKYPILIFTILMLITLFLSIIVEATKSKLGFYTLQSHLSQKFLG